MKCFNCGKSEAVFSEDCLVVEHKVNDFMNTRMESERLVGVTRAGLCPRCLNEASQNCSHLIGTQWLSMAAGAMLFVGAALYFLGGRLDAPVVTAKLNLVQMIGLALAAAGGPYLLLRNLLAPSMLRKTPWKIMGNWPNATLNPVPVGDGYYRNYRDFKAINPFLGKEISEKIYSEIIETGAWRTMVEGNKE
ncbi:MAG: hypothetical protein IJI26_10785 [Clostridia bacterium]|nr:hypothetical protein [Clostridia bacterium]